MVGRDDNIFKFDHIEFEVCIKYSDVDIQQPEVNTNVKEVGLARAKDWQTGTAGRENILQV